MPDTISLTTDRLRSFGRIDQAVARRKLNTTQAVWHAAVAGGSGAIDVNSAFSDPAADECARIPEIELDAAATGGVHTLTGTLNGESVTVTITAVQGTTVKADAAMSTITRWQGPDPGAGKNATLHVGDVLCEPAGKQLWTGTLQGDIHCTLSDDDQSIVTTLPPQTPIAWEISRIVHTTTTLVNAEIWW